MQGFRRPEHRIVLERLEFGDPRMEATNMRKSHATYLAGALFSLVISAIPNAATAESRLFPGNYCHVVDNSGTSVPATQYLTTLYVPADHHIVCPIISPVIQDRQVYNVALYFENSGIGWNCILCQASLCVGPSTITSYAAQWTSVSLAPAEIQCYAQSTTIIYEAIAEF
jgi:hypothetical protein